MISRDVFYINPLIADQDFCKPGNIGRFDPYSAGIDFSRQNLTSVGVRFSEV